MDLGRVVDLEMDPYREKGVGSRSDKKNICTYATNDLLNIFSILKVVGLKNASKFD